LPATRILGSNQLTVTQPCLVPRHQQDTSLRPLCLGLVLQRDSAMVGRRGKGLSAFVEKLNFDNSINEVVNLDTLAQSEDKLVLEEQSEFQIYPDENTHTALFNGIRFNDLPIVHLTLHKNNSKIHARHADGKKIHYTTPVKHGFLGSKKKTNVAGQVAGLNMGQKLRGIGIKTIRLRINGFNAARISTVQGITQAGIQIVAIQDVTPIDWHWVRKAKGRPSKN